jgi:hypothetical protein
VISNRFCAHANVTFAAGLWLKLAWVWQLRADEKGGAWPPYVNIEVICFYCFKRQPVLKIQATAEMHRNKKIEIAAKETPTGTSETSKNDQRKPEIR